MSFVKRLDMLTDDRGMKKKSPMTVKEKLHVQKMVVHMARFKDGVTQISVTP